MRKWKQQDKRYMKNGNSVKIIVDTNLWISFLIGKKLSCLLELVSNGDIELVASEELIEEISIVASRPKFVKYFSKEHYDMLRDFMTEETLFYKIDDIPERCRDPKDDFLLELALVSDANYLITGDKDLLSIGRIGTCQIITVMEFNALVASWGHTLVAHEDLETYYAIVIGE